MSTKPNQALIYRRVPSFLRELREATGMTQRQLAKRLGRSQWWVARCETGSRRIDVAEFIEFCRGCGVEPERAISALAPRRR